MERQTELLGGRGSIHLAFQLATVLCHSQSCFERQTGTRRNDVKALHWIHLAGTDYITKNCQASYRTLLFGYRRNTCRRLSCRQFLQYTAFWFQSQLFKNRNDTVCYRRGFLHGFCTSTRNARSMKTTSWLS